MPGRAGWVVAAGMAATRRAYGCQMSETFSFSDFKEAADAYLVEALLSLESLADRATRVAAGAEGELDAATAGKVSAIAEMARRATNAVAAVLHNELRPMT